jgi:hypothetical protein
LKNDHVMACSKGASDVSAFEDGDQHSLSQRSDCTSPAERIVDDERTDELLFAVWGDIL